VGAAVPEAERRRLSALDSYRPPELSRHSAFVNAARIVAHFLDMPVAAVGLIEEGRIRLAAGVGVDASELPRSWALTPQLLAAGTGGAAVVVPDTRREPAFVNQPMAVRAWAAAPLTTPAGLVIGAIFVADHQPHVLSPTQVAILEGMANFVMTELEVRRTHVGLDATPRHFESLLRDASDTVAVLDADGALAYISPALLRLLGYPADALVNGSGLVHEDDMAPLVGSVTVAMARPGITGPVEFRMAHGDGSWRSMEAVFSNCFDDPAVGGVVVYLRDITERHRHANILAAEARVLEAIARGAPVDQLLRSIVDLVEPVIPGGRVVIRSIDNARRMLPIAAAPNLPTSFTSAIAQWPLDARTRGFAASFRKGETVVVQDLTTVPDCDPAFQALAAAHRLRAAWVAPAVSPRTKRLVGTLSMYLPEPGVPTESQRRLLTVAASLVALAFERHGLQEGSSPFDIMARPELLRRLDATLLRAVDRDGKVAVMLLDLDRFKEVNEGLGHEGGDMVLPLVARRLAKAVRPEDMVVRSAGDEFVVVCEGLVGELEAVGVAERINAALREPMRVRRSELRITASIGIAMTHGEDDHAEALLRDADAALYQAKQRGRARFELFNGTRRREARDRRLLDSELERAVEEGELRVWLQPEIELVSGRLIGFEALVRWEHPSRGLLAPGEFIPQAERSGLIDRVGGWVLQEACRYGRRWQDDHPADRDSFVVSVNLSARQLSEPGLADRVAAALAATGLGAGELCLELTESALMDDAEVSLLALRSLKSLGVRLAIDDFGTGYSSLAYLRRFPIDAVKIDRSFVSGLGSRSEDGAIVTAVLSLADALGLLAIAEGVEQVLQRDELVRLGCEAAQGFLFSPPRPAEEMLAHV
jgi:diguanylate cyclase (GGDEF)-like protein/PAS domain S-box-containing protein